MRYRAFISYSHRDEAFVRRLHRRIEGWRIPGDLVGRQGAFGPVPQALRPVFRDRDDFSGAASLREATMAALRDSEAMVVVCSPAAAASAHVGEEIRLFKTLGRAGRIVPVIAPEAPAGPAQDSFPFWLGHAPGEGGAPAGPVADPIAADARDSGDGQRRAVAKVVAGLLGVPFDEIVRREERDRRARNALFAGAGLGAFVFATGFSAYALYQTYRAGVIIEKSVASIGGLLLTTDGLDDAENRRDMLRMQCDLIDGLAEGRDIVGLRERGICLFERAASAISDRSPREKLAMLCAWRDGLARDVLAIPEPDYDRSVALAQALDRAYRQIEAAPEAAVDCDVGGHEGTHGHLAFMHEKLADLARRRSDIPWLRDLHEKATWRLVEIREDADDWRGSEALMRQAAELRRGQASQLTGEEEWSAGFQRGIYLRRLGWLLVHRIGDAQAAAVDATEAVEYWRTATAARPDHRAAAYQAVLAHAVSGDALAALSRRDEAIAALAEGLERAEKLVDSAESEKAPLLREAKAEAEYLRERLAALGAPATARAGSR